MSTIELAFEIQRLLDERVLNNRAEIAERCGVSRARVTQVLKLLRLPAADSGGAVWNERQPHDVLHRSSEDDQIAAVMAMTEPAQTGCLPAAARQIGSEPHRLQATRKAMANRQPTSAGWQCAFGLTSGGARCHPLRPPRGRGHQDREHTRS